MPHSKARPELSPREQQLLNLAADGLTDSAIAHELGISEATVGTYWGRVRIKLGPYNRTELVAMALREESERMLQALKEENARLAERLRTAEAPYRDLVEFAPDAILVVDEAGTIQMCNRRLEELFGFEREELLGQTIRTLIPERYHESHRQHLQQYMEHPERRRMGQHLATLARRKRIRSSRVPQPRPERGRHARDVYHPRSGPRTGDGRLQEIVHPGSRGGG
jgi:PAS domain S-box-containing protein